MEAIEILTKRKQSMEEIAVRNEIPFNKKDLVIEFIKMI